GLAADRRDAPQLAPRAGPGHALRAGDGHRPEPEFPAPATRTSLHERVPDPGGDPERGLRALGPVRRRPGDPADGQLGARRGGGAGSIPLWGTRLSGPGMLPTAIVLGIMVLPTIVAISREALESVPHKLREAAYGMGATHWETILRVVVPTAAPGIAGSIILA